MLAELAVSAVFRRREDDGLTLDPNLFTGNDANERGDNWWHTLRALRNTCTIGSNSADGSSSGTMSCPEILQAVVNTAGEACKKGWIVESVLTANRSHEDARALNPSSLATSFQNILADAEARGPLGTEILSDEMLQPLVQSLSILYDTDDNCGERCSGSVYSPCSLSASSECG